MINYTDLKALTPLLTDWERRTEIALQHRLTPDESYKLFMMYRERQRMKNLLKDIEAQGGDTTKVFNALCRHNVRIYDYCCEHGFREIWVPPFYQYMLHRETYDICKLVCDDVPRVSKDRKTKKWGAINPQEEQVIPFEYDELYRLYEQPYMLLGIKDGKQGLITTDAQNHYHEVIPCDVDQIYYIDYRNLFLYTKDGKWGWWWDSEADNHYSTPVYDEIYLQTPEEFHDKDNVDEFFEARRGDEVDYILMWAHI